MNRNQSKQLLVIDQYFNDLEKVFAEIDLSSILTVIDLFSQARTQGNRIFFIGNGGSSATASHAVCDLTKTILGINPLGSNVKPFKAINLSDNVPSLSAWANDVGYESVFAGQLQAYAQEGDLLVAVSASGNSPNILNAVSLAKDLGLSTIGWVGFDGGQLKLIADYCVHIPHNDYGVVEDLQMILVHIITRYFKNNNDPTGQ